MSKLGEWQAEWRREGASCRNCGFFVPLPGNGEGTCYCMPPHTSEGHPRVRGDDICGQFKDGAR